MKVIKTIWGGVAVIWLFIIGFNLFINIDYAESAMQASQLYDEASMNILRIITITLLLNLGNESTDKLSEQIQQQAKGLTEQSKRIADVLDRLERHMGNSTTPNNRDPETINEVNQTNPVVSPIVEQPVTEASKNHLCPKCRAPMQIRTVTKGEHLGKQFYVCSNYPTCREVLPV